MKLKKKLIKNEKWDVFGSGLNLFQSNFWDFITVPTSFESMEFKTYEPDTQTTELITHKLRVIIRPASEIPQHNI
jgi:hypothetical protein